MIRKFITSVICASLIISGFSQESNSTNTPDPKLYEVYSSDYIDRLIENQPDLIAFLNFKLSHSYEVVDLTGKIESNNYPLLSNVQIRSKETSLENSNALTDYNSNNLNVLKYKFETKKNQSSYYQVDGTDFCLKFYSEQELLDMFKKSLLN